MILPTKEQLELFKSTPGAISVCEMVAIINVAAQAPVGTCAEMGSHRGKSGVAAAIGLSNTKNTQLHMVDPLYDMENLEAWSHACQGHPDNAWQGAKDGGFKLSVIHAVDTATKSITPVLHGDYSTNAIPRLFAELGPFSYVFIDSDVHAYPLLRQECDLLWDKMVMGGIICFHDYLNQHVDVERVYREMLQGGKFEEIPIDWESIKSWVNANGGEAGNDSWHNVDNPNPTFVGAIKRIR